MMKNSEENFFFFFVVVVVLLLLKTLSLFLWVVFKTKVFCTRDFFFSLFLLPF